MEVDIIIRQQLSNILPPKLLHLTMDVPNERLDSINTNQQTLKSFSTYNKIQKT